jgi:MOSC domain-containing protein YiiM
VVTTSRDEGARERRFADHDEQVTETTFEPDAPEPAGRRSASSRLDDVPAGRKTMRVLSVNVGLPREVLWRGKTVTTGIYKEPVCHAVHIGTLNLDGDRQADLRVHGGREKAVYAYPSEFYELWRHEQPELGFGPGQFGENLTTEGLLDEDVSVGDRFRIGTAELVVTQPRLPCFKLGIKMRRNAFVTEFFERGLYGFYFAVAREGEVEAGDPIVQLSRDPRGFRVTEVARLYARGRDDIKGLRRAADLDVLPDSWRDYFRKRLSARTS